jgi:ferric-dicitrate binding protein FerR (iron transport regulator)
MDANLLKRYFANKYSRKDLFTIHTAFRHGDKNILLKRQMEQHWLDFDENILPDVQLDSILDKVQHRIYIEENRKVKPMRFWQTLQRVAAILFLPLLIGSVAYYWIQPNQESESSWAEIQCPLGVRTKFHLPDGTIGFLNSGSTLKYPVIFAENRKVKLAGEAYFDVVHDDKSPFHVITKNLDVKVLGTTFNVIAYDGEGTEEIVLQTGHVEVMDTNGSNLATLSPDQKLVLLKGNRKFTVEKVVSDQYTSWKDGKLMFRNENIKDVAVRLSRWYNAEIVINESDKHILSYTFHGTFVDEQLNDVLKVLSFAAPISYLEVDRKSDRNGLYSKRKIILSTNPNKIKEFE